MTDLLRNPVIGAICGDIIGVPYEWYCKHGLQVPKDFKLITKDSKFSDDSVMTIAVADWLLGVPPFNTDELVKCMQTWGRRYSNSGYGHLFRKWLFEDDPQPYGSYGNGSAMRVSPVGCVAQTCEEVRDLAKMSASVSHNHPEGIKGAQCVAEMIWNNLHKHNNGETEIAIPTEYYPTESLTKTPEQIIKSGYRFDSTCQGSVPEAICCFLHSNSYEETIRNAIMLRGDADTQAAIAGSIAAAYWGVPRDIAEDCLELITDEMFYILEAFSLKYGLDFI